jgi:hypothetical protein
MVKAKAVLQSEGSSNATRTNDRRALRPPRIPKGAIPEDDQRTIRKPEGNTSGGKIRAEFSEHGCKAIIRERRRKCFAKEEKASDTETGFPREQTVRSNEKRAR